MREIACTSALRCLALTWGHNLFRVDGLGPLSQPDEFFPTRVLVTSNGAKTWSPVHVPAVPRGDRYSFGSITCATSARCVVTGIRAHIEVHQGGYTPINRVAVVLSVRDAGHAAALETPNVPQVGPISCPGATACLMVTSSPVGRAKVYVSWDGGDSWEKVPERGLPDKWTWTRLECISAASCLVWTTGGGVATTDDGGHDWVVTSTVPSPPPGDRTGGITDVTCARSGRCLALQELFPPTAPTGPATVAVRILTNPTSMP